jgi:hypothetical protein
LFRRPKTGGKLSGLQKNCLKAISMEKVRLATTNCKEYNNAAAPLSQTILQVYYFII